MFKNNEVSSFPRLAQVSSGASLRGAVSPHGAAPFLWDPRLHTACHSKPQTAAKYELVVGVARDTFSALPRPRL